MCMGFKTKGVQLPLSNGKKALSYFACQTVFGFFRQQIVAEIISGLQEMVHMICQTDRERFG